MGERNKAEICALGDNDIESSIMSLQLLAKIEANTKGK